LALKVITEDNLDKGVSISLLEKNKK